MMFTNIYKHKYLISSKVLFGTLRKDLCLIDNVTERSVRYMYRITFPLFWIFFGYCSDVPGVGVFSRIKSAGFVSGLGASFRLFHFSTVTPVTINFLIHTQKFFVYLIPPYLFGGLLSRLDRLIFSCWIQLMLQLVDSGRLFRRYRDFRNHFLHRLFRLPRFRSRIRFADFVHFSAFR